MSPPSRSRRLIVSTVGELAALGWLRREQMWTLSVVVGRVAAEHVGDVAAAGDQQPVETLGADSTDEAFSVSVGLWRADRCVDDRDSFAAEDLVEGGGEFAVAVVDQEPVGCTNSAFVANPVDLRRSNKC
jgi:hypothetical protein